MSRTIDERVLQMEFDNKKFEKGAQESIATLEKLNKSCQLEGATEGFSGLQQAIDNINNHFTIMGRLTERVMDTIVDKVQSTVSSVVNMTKSLTVDQFSAGFEKYESITASTQTIMGALSDSDRKIISDRNMEDIDYVTEQISRMNQYTDETSYNLTDMTSNVGKFMSAGIDLQSAVSAMEGIANWAARSGANVQQASHAMYNLSQAMGTGYVQLMDWKSIENASMATKEFKEQVIATAKSMGTLTSDVEKKAGEVTASNFNSTLQYKWFTSDVLMQTLEDYNEFYNQILKLQQTEEGSAMTVTQIIGELQDNTELGAKWIKEYGIDLNSLSAQSFLAAQEYKSFSDVISATSDAISTSWMNIFQYVFGNLEESKDLWSRVGDDFYDIFAQPVADLQEIMRIWKELGGRNRLLDAFDNLRSAVDSFISPIKAAFGDIFGYFGDGDQQDQFAHVLVGLTNKLKKFTESMILSEDAQNGIRVTFRELFRVVQLLAGAFTDLLGVGGSIIKFVADIGEGLFGFVSKLGEGTIAFDSFNKSSKSFKGIIDSVAHAIRIFYLRLKEFPIIGQVIDWITWLVTVIKDTLGTWLDWAIAKFEELTGIKLEFKFPKVTLEDFQNVLQKIVNVAQHVLDVFKANWDPSTPVTFFKSIWESAKKLREEFANWADAKWTEWINADGPLQNFVKSIMNLDPKGQLEKVGDGIKQVGGSIKQWFDGVNWKMVGEVGIVSVLAALIVKFKKQIDKLMGLGKDFKETFTDTFTAPFKSFSKAMNAAATDMKADALVKAAEAITLLAISLTLLAHLDSDQLARCTVSLLALMLGLSKLINSKSNSDMAKGAKALTSIKDVLSDFADGVVGALKNLAMGALVISAVASLAALAVVLKMFDWIKWESLAKAGAILVTLGGGIYILMKAMSTMENLRASNLLAIAGMITVIAPSLVTLALAAKAFEKVKDLTNMVVAMTAITTMIGLLSVAVAASSSLAGNGQNSLKGVAGAITSMVGAILLLGALNSISSKGLAGMTAMIFNMTLAMSGLVAAAVVIQKLNLNKTIGKLVGAMKQLSNLAYSMTTFNLSLAALIAVFSIFPDGLAKVAKSIKDNAKTIAVAIVEVITLVLTTMAAYKFKYAASLIAMVVAIVEMVKDQSDQIITPLMEILGDVLNAVAKFIDDAVQYVVPALVRVINSIADAIRNNADPILKAISNLWDAIVGIVSKGISGFTGLDLGLTEELVDFAGKAAIIAGSITKISSAFGLLSKAKTTKNGIFSFFTKSTFSNVVNNLKAIPTLFTGIRKGIANTGLSIFSLGTKLSGKNGLVGSIGGLAENAGLATIKFAQFLPKILLIGGAIAGVAAVIKLGLAKTEQLREETYGINSSTRNVIDNLNSTSDAIEKVIDSSDKELASIQAKYDAYDSLAQQYDKLDDKSSSDGLDLRKQMANGLDITLEDLDKLIEKYGSAEAAMKNYYTKQRAEEYLTTLQNKKQSITDELSGTIEDRQKLVEEYDQSVTELDDLNQDYERLIRSVAKNHATTYNAAKEMVDSGQGLEAFEESERNNVKDGISRKLAAIGELKDKINEYSDIIAELNQTNSTINALQSEITALDASQTEEELQTHRDNINNLLSSIKLNQEDLVEAGKATADAIEEQTNTSLSAFQTMYDSYTRGLISDEEWSSQISVLTDAIRQGGQSAKEALQESINDATDVGDTNLATILQGVYDSLANDQEELTKLGTEAGETVKTGFLENLLTSISTGSMGTDEVLDALEQQMGEKDFSAVFANSGTKIIDGLKTALSNTDLSTVMDSINTEGIAAAAGVKIDEAVKEATSGGTSGVASYKISAPMEIDPQVDIIKTSQSIQTAVNTAVDSVSIDASPNGEEFDQSFATDITNNSSVVSTAAEGVANTGKNSLEVDTTSSGQNFLAGFAAGLESFAGSIGRRCYQLAQSFVAKFNAGLDEHSPSKATAKSGVFFLKGFVNGIDSYKNTANKKVADSAEDMVNAFSDSLSYVNGIITDNLDVNPTITPVLDLTQIQNGSTQLASMLGTPAYTMRTAAVAAGGFASPTQIQTDSLNQSMSSAMADLISAQQQSADQTYTFNIPLDINGRQIAKATRTYTQSELNNLNTIMNRKGGVRG